MHGRPHFILFSFISYDVLDSRVRAGQVVFHESGEGFAFAKVVDGNPVHFFFYAVGCAVAVELLSSARFHQEIKTDFVAVKSF